MPFPRDLDLIRSAALASRVTVDTIRPGPT
jgi:hypothetical protein